MPQNAMYIIRIAQPLTEADVSWFDGLTIYQITDAETTLLTPPIDQTGLHGILAILRDLAIPLVAVFQIRSPPPRQLRNLRRILPPLRLAGN